MGFKIIRAYSAGEKSRVGNEYGDYKGREYLFRTLDDDGNVAYHAFCDGDGSAERFHYWSANDVGTCWSQYKKDGEWKEFIG